MPKKLPSYHLSQLNPEAPLLNSSLVFQALLKQHEAHTALDAAPSPSPLHKLPLSLLKRMIFVHLDDPL